MPLSLPPYNLLLCDGATLFLVESASKAMWFVGDP